MWDPRVIKPLDPEMLDDAADHRLVVTVEDGLRDGGVGSAIADALSELGRPAGPRVRVLGVPSVYLPHGKPDAILTDSASTPTASSDEVLAWVSSSARTK